MLTVLSKIFIVGKNTSDERKAWGYLCSGYGIFLNILLFVGKFFAGFVSGSIAIMADAFNNLSDAGASVLSFVGFWLAGKKPDVDHPFGHGRFEYVSGMGVAVLIILMGAELAKSSVEKILNPEPISTGSMTIAILVVSILVKLYMALYNNSIGNKINSAAMKATAADSMSDVGATTVVLAATLVSGYSKLNIDGICGGIVSVVIIFAGISVLRETISPLLGKQPDPELVDEIYEIVLRHDMIKGIHDLVVHDYGPGRLMISLHTEVSGNENIFIVHDLIDNIESELKEKLGCSAVIHMDPIETDNELVNEMRKNVLETIRKINSKMTIHDFRAVVGESHTNLIFDVLVPFDVREDDDTVKKMIAGEIKKIDAKYNAVIQVDRGCDVKRDL